MQARMQMNQPNPAMAKLAAGCGVLFSLPFIGAGVFVIAMALAGDVKEKGLPLVMVVFGSVFVIAGLVLAVGSILRVRRVAEEAAIRAAAPNEPWRWRSDWAAGYAEELSRKAGAGLLAFALFWLLLSSFLVLVIPQALQRGQKNALVALIFPAIGLAVLAFALYRILQARKFGRTILHLGSVPFVPGRNLSATLRSKVETLPENGFNVKLLHVHRWLERSGKNSSYRERVLWEQSAVVPRGAVAPSPETVSIPINIAIPADAPETDDTVSSNRRLWRVEVKADIPGIDFAAQFEVPVFRKELPSANADEWPS